ncbi:hypothetical protein I3842_03G214900 [Carya illinoinensis]|uniref:Golgin candidate 1 n=1 Tax=Carya illinoinensis TaxID=32201 RepID=A0A922FMN2_CARIL|nr:hypothetical protein I3842_03G214900 [Carya illinoinensis]
MASWLKAAEGLFEVVDRRAKLVVSELSDEQSDSQSAAANGQGSHAKRKSKTKSQKKVPRIESDTSQDQTSAMMPLVDVKPENDMAVQLVENDGTPTISISQTNNVQEHNIEKDSPLVGIPPTERPVSDVVENNDRHMEVPSILTDVEAVSSTSNGELVNENASDVPNEHPFLSLPAEKVEIFNEDIPNDASQSIKSGDTDVKLKIDLESSQSVSTDFPRNSDTQLKDAVIKVEPLVDQKRQQELKVDDSQMKVQEQLDEAQGLLKTTVSTGQSKEARLARVCAGLSSRLQEYKSENAQLEELLISERELSKSFEAHMKQLQQDLSESKSEVSRVESNMVEALAAKNSEIEALVSSLDTLKKQAASSEGNLASLQAAELEQKVALLEVECASLNQELQDMEARARRGQKKSLDEANQMIQMQAWQEEVERARQGQRDAEGKLSSLEAEVQKMRVEMAAMRRDAEHYSRQEHMELEKRYRELTDLLYCKQTQLEAMVSEKAAAEFQLEKEKKRIQEVQVEVERSRVSRRALTTWEEDTEIKALEPLPLYHRHMVGASLQLQKAAKLLDSGAVRATRFLWRYPTARVILLFYLVFVHFFLMYLLHRLQAQADSLDAREVAESMGLADPTLP